MPAQKDAVYVYGAHWCPFCVNAKKMLEEPHGRQAEYVDIGDRGLKHAAKFPEHRDQLKTIHTVPAVFVGAKYLGGSDALRRHLSGARTMLGGGLRAGALARKSAPKRKQRSKSAPKLKSGRKATPARRTSGRKSAPAQRKSGRKGAPSKLKSAASFTSRPRAQSVLRRTGLARTKSLLPS
jgi:glutaredoxin